jgi:hypothetical protein
MVAKKYQSPSGGLNAAGRAYFKRTEGSNLKAPVTGSVKKGSKAANRRKSFCARMSGVKGAMVKNGKPTRKALALKNGSVINNTFNSCAFLLEGNCQYIKVSVIT